MRTSLAIALSLLVAMVGLPTLASAADAPEPVIKQGDRLAMLGDSITDQRQYTCFIETYLTACMPQLDIWCFEFGWGGETAGGFVGRMDYDLLPFKPTLVTICYGMNDGGYRPYDDGTGKWYTESMKKLVETLKDTGATVIIGSPGGVDTQTWGGPERAAMYNATLDRLADIDRDLAKEEGMPFVDLHALMMDVMKKAKAAYGVEYHLCGNDGVHPWSNGHLVMAYAFLKGMGLDGNLATITVEADGKTTASEGHEVLAHPEGTSGTIELVSHRYPFCFFVDKEHPEGPNSTPTILPHLPFNQDLNRFVLVVKGLKTPKAKVTWGSETKTFTKEELAKGVNLAAEFLDNPFREPFRKVLEAVSQKEGFEAFFIHSFNGTMRDIGNSFGKEGDPDVEAAAQTIRAKLVDKHNALAKIAKEAVVPVKHTITIEEVK